MFTKGLNNLNFHGSMTQCSLLSAWFAVLSTVISFFVGIDLSECLQYPDFSVVVLYKKVIIAFGFMVPDVKYNEAYISFLFVHPEWRRAGIATFMIYHLIQVMKKSRVSAELLAPPPSLCAHACVGEEVVLCSSLWSLSPCPLFTHIAAQIVYCQQPMWMFLGGLLQKQKLKCV